MKTGSRRRAHRARQKSEEHRAQSKGKHDYGAREVVKVFAVYRAPCALHRFHGGIRSFQVAEKIVDEGYADYVSMSRPFICEPDLVKRWASGDRGKAECFSDNQCFGPGMAGGLVLPFLSFLGAERLRNASRLL